MSKSVAESYARNRPVDYGDEDWSMHLQRLAAANNSLQHTLNPQFPNEASWQRERELFRAMIDQVPDYLFVKDRDSRFVIANKAVAADLGIEPEALIGKTDFDLHSIALAEKFFADEQHIIATEQPMVDIEEFVIQSTGHQKWLSSTKVPMRDKTGKVVGVVGVCRDVTDRKQAQAQIQYMAHHDALTGLPNRVLLMDRLTQAVANAQRAGTSVAAVFIDLDKFKIVNDTLGHKAGDTLLKTVAERMAACVGKSDTVARLSGDEFIVLLEGGSQDSRARAMTVVKRLQSVIAQPVTIESHSLQVSCSIGIATYPTDAGDPDSLLSCADLAMYRAKHRGRDSCAFHADIHE